MLNDCFFYGSVGSYYRSQTFKGVVRDLRTLQRIKSKCPMGSTITTDVLSRLHNLWSSNDNHYTDWDCLLLWDTTDKEKDVTYYRHQLKGLGEQTSTFTLFQLRLYIPIVNSKIMFESCS